MDDGCKGREEGNEDRLNIQNQGENKLLFSRRDPLPKHGRMVQEFLIINMASDFQEDIFLINVPKGYLEECTLMYWSRHNIKFLFVAKEDTSPLKVFNGKESGKGLNRDWKGYNTTEKRIA